MIASIQSFSLKFTVCSGAFVACYLVASKGARTNSFLNHHFIKLAWLSGWKALISDAKWSIVFPRWKRRLTVVPLPKLHYA